jgi:hypothetical protein
VSGIRPTDPVVLNRDFPWSTFCGKFVALYVLEVEGKSANKLKKEIEKKNRFCLMEQVN